MKTVGTYLVELLSAYGVETVFGIPGVHTLELYRGLEASGIRHVTARHEQGLGFMADGYARAGGKPGVCFVITGPGLTNIATAMGQAYADSIPMLVISSVNALGKLGSGNGCLHELPDQRALASQVAAFSHTVTTATELPQVVARAFAVFDGARPRPVHIEIPLDVLAASADALPAVRPPARIARGPAAASAIAAAVTALRQARRPLLLAGGGARGAAPELRQLAERLDAPTVMTINGRGILPPDHPLGLSFSPSFPAVRALVAQSDVVLAVGTELGPTDYDMYVDGRFALPGTLIRLDIDAEQAFRNHAPDVALLGDAAETLRAVLAALDDAPASAEGAARAAATRAAGPADLDATMQRDLAFLQTVRDTLPDAILVGDSTRQVYAGNLGFAATAPRTWFNASTGFGALGYGLPAALGASLAAPGRCIVCLAGDGGFQFSLAELGTAVELAAPLIVLLLNNRGYGEIKAAMRGSDVAPLGVDLHTPDFAAVARAYGWHAETTDETADIAPLLAAARGRREPTLIEIHAKPVS